MYFPEVYYKLPHVRFGSIKQLFFLTGMKYAHPSPLLWGCFFSRNLISRSIARFLKNKRTLQASQKQAFHYGLQPQPAAASSCPWSWHSALHLTPSQIDAFRDIKIAVGHIEGLNKFSFMYQHSVLTFCGENREELYFNVCTSTKWWKNELNTGPGFWRHTQKLPQRRQRRKHSIQDVTNKYWKINFKCK